MHIKDREEHDVIFERSIRTVKERGRKTCHYVPYKNYAKLTTNSLVEGAIYWLNAFPTNIGVSKNIGPARIIIGRPQPYFNIRRIAFESYAIASEDNKNDRTLRGVPEIALRPSNDQVGHYFMSLLTGKHINAHHWEELPINEEVIMKVEEFLEKEKQSTIVDGMLIFEWRVGNLIDDKEGNMG